MLRLVIAMGIMFNSPIHSAHQSCMTLSSMGNEFQQQNNIDFIQSTTAYSTIFCADSYNRHRSRYVFDFDSSSSRCRLFRSDLTTGFIIPSSSATSTVGLIQLSPVLFLLIHNQPCEICAKNRYELCYSNTSICQCPLRTYWNGSMCLLQLIENIEGEGVGVGVGVSVGAYSLSPHPHPPSKVAGKCDAGYHCSREWYRYFG